LIKKYICKWNKNNSTILKNIIPFLFMIISNQFFISQNNPCISHNNIRVVILGSSTAAGYGTSNIDSAWVNKYRLYLETINSNNEVINLSQGGYSTYHIMKTGFSQPTGRPSPDINKNISAAIALNPDAIIINLPSNDVSLGFSYLEQMNNLDSIVDISNNNSVPIWICTTQPKNFSNLILRQLQSDIKDSILNRYYPRTIDFWTTISLLNNTIDSTFDSGDGTHLNDAGHNILANRVISINIPLELYNPISNVDYSIESASPSGYNGCGDSVTNFSVIIANLGIDNQTSSEIIFQVINQSTGFIFTDTLYQIGGINTCEIDTLNFDLNLYNKGTYSLYLHLNNPDDSINYNDSLRTEISTSGHPSVLGMNDILCEPGSTNLTVQYDSLDNIFWYHNLSDTIPIYNGQVLSTGFISSTMTVYAEAVRGDLFYRNYLKTTQNSNINWNGAMVDIVAKKNLIIDSLEVDFQTSSNAWTLLGSVYVNVTNNQHFTSIPLGNIPLNINDTIGVYIQLVDQSATLSYQSTTNPVSRSNNEVIIISGSGVSHNFSNSFFPRDLNFGVFYHFGNKYGDCSSEKIPITAFVSNSSFDLGNDTIIDIDDTININAPDGFSSYLWSTGSVANSVSIVANQLGPGIHWLSVSFIDSLGCEKSDSIILGISDLVGIRDFSSELILFPNPNNGEMKFNKVVEQATIFNLLGETVSKIDEPFNSLTLSNLPYGTYFISVFENNKKEVLKFFIKTP
jgi:lysophospholipase L1-like esterase